MDNMHLKGMGQESEAYLEQILNASGIRERFDKIINSVYSDIEYSEINVTESSMSVYWVRGGNEYGFFDKFDLKERVILIADKPNNSKISKLFKSKASKMFKFIKKSDAKEE